MLFPSVLARAPACVCPVVVAVGVVVSSFAHSLKSLTFALHAFRGAVVVSVVNVNGYRARELCCRQSLRFCLNPWCTTIEGLSNPGH